MSTIKPQKNYYFQESNRLFFVPLEKEHIPLWKSFFVENDTLDFLGFKNLKGDLTHLAEEWISKQMERKTKFQFGQLAVFEKKSNNFIGVAGIIQREIAEKTEYEVTYSLLAEYRRKGFATEAATMFKNFIFLNAPIESVISIIHRENQSSINVAEKNGMSISLETEFMDMPAYIFRVNKK